MVVEDEIIGKPLDDYIREKHNQDRCIGFMDGYKAATKVYSEEDAEKIYMQGYMDAIDGKNHHNEKLSDYLQSLKPKTPKYFIAETKAIKSEVFRENDNAPYVVLKTTTINGKTYLVGTYKFE